MPLDKSNNSCIEKDFPLSHQEQFQIYLDIFKEKNDELKLDKNIDLIRSTFQFFMNRESKFEFYFFFSGFH